jgi:LacI family transcriptional regulator
MVTMKDVAKELGISIQSVSAVLNGKAEKYRISAATCERVTQKAQQMGYQLESNMGARQLAASKFGHRILNDVIAITAIVTPGDDNDSSWALHHHPYSGEIVRGIEETAHRYGLDVLLCRLYENKLPRLLEKRDVDGIIPISSSPESWKNIARLNIPTVKMVGPQPGVHNLLVDNRSGIRQIVEHLASLGHRHIAYLGHRIEMNAYESILLGASRERVAAFREIMQELNLSTAYMDTSLKHQTRELAARQACLLLQKHPEITAIACHNDTLAIGAINGIQSLGLRVPDDISVAGFDNWASQTDFTPAVTSVETHRYELGKRAVEMIWETRERWCAGEAFPLLKEIHPVNLSVHQSTREVKK